MFQNQKPLLVCFGISSALAALSLSAIFLARQSNGPAPPADGSLPRAPSASAVEQAPPVVELPPLHIVGTLHRPRPTLRASARVPDTDLVPCSDWRALGPVYSAKAGEAPRERHVRLLCQRSDSELEKRVNGVER